MLDDIKTLLGIEIIDNSKDSILNIYIRKGIILIKNYLNNSTFDDTYIQTNFSDAIIEIVVNAYNINLNTQTGIKQTQQGSRNIIYKDDTSTFVITDSVKNLLPRPYIKLM